MRSPSAAVAASGFSQNTCLPAAAAAIAIGACRKLGAAMLTRSTSGLATTSSQSAVHASKPSRAAAAFATASSASATRTRRTSGTSGPQYVRALVYAMACARATLPAPIRPTRIGGCPGMGRGFGSEDGADQAPIHQDGGARDVARLAGGQERDQVRHLLRIADPSDRRLRGTLGQRLLHG